jgi:hypothetical protein
MFNHNRYRAKWSNVYEIWINNKGVAGIKMSVSFPKAVRVPQKTFVWIVTDKLNIREERNLKRKG